MSRRRIGLIRNPGQVSR